MKSIFIRRSGLCIIIIFIAISVLFGCSGDKGDTIYTTSNDVPEAPTNTQAVAGDGKVTVSWSPVAGATSYNIYWNTVGSVSTSDTSIISTPSPYMHTGLTNDTTYYYVVTAVNIEGESALSTEVSATPQAGAGSTPPATPDGLVAAATDGQVTISWSPVSGATSYNIYWNTAGSVTTADSVIGTSTTILAHPDLTNGTQYYYAVTALSDKGESALSTEVSATPQAGAGSAPPAAPTGVTATPVDSQVTLSWSPVAGATSYNIYWNTAGSVTTSDNMIGTSTTLFTHPGLTNWTTYYYAVSAVNADGESGLSSETSAMPKIPFSEMLQKMYGSDAQAGDEFGYFVSMSGDYAIVGTPYEDGGPGDPIVDAGAAYIFHRTGPNSWDAGYKVVASDAQFDDLFGISVSISGDYAIVGARYEDGGTGDPLTDAGAAYIFHRTGTNTWDTGTKIASLDLQGGDEFGYSVSINGDYAIVGAHYESGGPGDPLISAGAAYIFHRTGTTTWDTGTKITASDAQAIDQLGHSVSISGDYAIAGARYEDGGAGDPLSNAGAAYIFHRTGPNTWNAGTKITAIDAQVDDCYGQSVSISGDYAVVGSYQEDGGGGDPILSGGAAYIYRRTGTNTWDAGTKIVASDAQASDNFGWSVAISGDHVIVGAYHEDGGTGDPMPNAGAAYIFRRTGLNAWDAGTKIVAPDAQTGDYFGSSVAIDGDSALVGAWGEDGGAGDPLSGAGAAYIY